MKNTATNLGGAILLRNVTARIMSSVFEENTAWIGGSVYVENKKPY